MQKWLTDTIERAVRTAAQAALGVVGAGQLGLLDVDWGTTGSVAGLAAVVSVLTSIAAGRTGDPQTAGFVTSRR
ncbi:holin [Microbispora sp. RL4-1S]|uniref:Holin n=1 Tax=Microbispora oryzae TaxID=2806554 RepID=A0A941AHR4_9ACTN|nr:holin [Microbispora oryzae]MBP2704380.1 holin [Microbispora oryzae]